ncbi:AAA family ATPase [Candidatus Pacearchaeota archaeon]|nr:AAA family ATPase [Candidatus Pacearchaeota archaeon]
MKFKKIKVKNLRSYKEQEIEFPEGSLLLSGDIGTGKTSILLALEYALFGLQAGQKGTALLRNTEQTAEIVLDLEASGKLITIERRLKRTIKGVSNEYASITIDGQKEESSLTEIKHKIISLLGYPEEFVKKNNLLYRYTVYTQQEQMKQIILDDSETRLNILRHVFGIDKYKSIKNNLSILLLDLKSGSKILQGEITTLEQDKFILEERKSKLTKTEQVINEKALELEQKKIVRKDLELQIKDLESKIKEKKDFENEVEKTKITIINKKELSATLNREIIELSKSITEVPNFSEKEYSSLIQEMKEVKSSLELFNNQFIETASRINSFEKERLEILSKKERIFKIDICPTCLQDVSETHKHNILNETESRLSKIKKELEELKSSHDSISKSIERSRKNISELEEEKTRLEILRVRSEQIGKSKLKLIELEKQKEFVEEDCKKLFKHVDDLKEKILKYSIFDNKFRVKEEEMNKIKQEEKFAEIFLAELRKEAEISKKEIYFAEESISLKESSKKKLQNINELGDWLSTRFLNLIELTERNVLMKLRVEFSTLFRKWFNMLITEESLDSNLDENFTPIISQGEVEMDYSFLSGGERTAVALAYRLALNQTINSLMSKINTKGVIILDEPTEGFSETQIDKIRDVLQELNAEQLIIVSHEQKIEGFVDNVLKVSKHGDISVIGKGAP